jgi:pimeloyl-ACP methyl ester carboxylesterase
VKRVLPALCGLLLAAGLLMTASTPAAKASANCAPDIGRRAPVLLVHGFLSNEATWNQGHPSMIQALGQVGGLYVRTFDYSRVNTHWVTDKNIGQPLADRIACLAAASRQAGGPGKVVIVAHSMGGLATRYAASLDSGGRPVESLLGLLITVGTPHLGSFLMAELSQPKLYADEHTLSFLIGASCGAADVASFGAMPDGVRKLCDQAAAGNSPAAFAMTPGSRELRKLPPMPGAVPVQAIAGSVDQVAFGVGEHPLRVELPKVGDLVVEEDSATAQHSTPGAGGGTTIVHCDNFVLPLGPMPDCGHLKETSNPLVEQSVIASIKQYLAAAQAAAKPLLPSFVGQWSVHGSQFTISSTRGYEVSNAGPCGSGDILDANRPWCEERVDYRLRLSADGRSLHATVTSVRVVESETGLPHPEVKSSSKVGEEFTLTFAGPNQLMRSPWPKGNPYLCNQRTPTRLQNRCGA